MQDLIPQQLGQYQIAELLGENATAYTYRGKKHKQEVLIKQFKQSLTQPEDQQAFLARGKQLKHLKHRNISHVLDALFHADRAFLVLEFIPEISLCEQITPGELLAPDTVRSYLFPLSDALSYAHAHSIAHNNLHPGNIVFKTRKDPTLYLSEFALKHRLLDDSLAAFPYMAPEQLEGFGTPASDQYSLAAMAYEWLTGHRPYAATDPATLLTQQRLAPPASLRTSNEAISPRVEQVILRALSQKPEERFPNIQDFATQYLNALMNLSFPVSTQPARKPVATPAPKPSAKSEITPPQPPRLIINRIAAPTPTTPIPKVVITPQVETKAPPAVKIEGFHLQSIVQKDLQQGGVLSRSLTGYEERPAQIEMARLVAEGISASKHTIVEASTGTGKSLAYLLPAVRSGQVTIVSTANKALQEQLFYKDIPFIQKHIQHFDAALVKGVGNYICLDRLEQEQVYTQMYAQNKEFAKLQKLVGDVKKPFNGDFETLPFTLPTDIRGRIATDNDQCAWNKCSFFDDCYVHKMRENANKAQIIVVNHTLLLLDATMDGKLLPERDLIIIDEAHHLEEEATRSFTITITSTQIQNLLSQRMLKDHTTPSLQDEVLRLSQQLWVQLELFADQSNKPRINLTEPLELGLQIATKVGELMTSLLGNRPQDLPDKESQLYDKLSKRLQTFAENMRTVFSVDQPEKFVYYLERSEASVRGGNAVLQISAAPLAITEWLQDKLFLKTNVISTSATLATAGSAEQSQNTMSFSYFRQRAGLDAELFPDTLERILPLTFDYPGRALLYVPRDLPEPAYGAASDEYIRAIAQRMYKLVMLSQGRAFLLFSSKRALDRSYELMSPHLPFPLLKQGTMGRIELTRRFRKEEGAILFGLKSFWEGVDIAGDALSLVVIDKLPFEPPDDPVHEARINRMKANGENWFGSYVLPQAILRLKQGIGRLLRSREDRGVMAILDTRLQKKAYGRQVMDALPPAKRTVDIKDVERFFTQTAKTK